MRLPLTANQAAMIEPHLLPGAGLDSARTGRMFERTLPLFGCGCDAIIAPMPILTNQRHESFAQFIATAVSVCRRFEKSRRRDLPMTYTMHEAVAYIPPQEADRLLKEAETNRMSSEALREIVKGTGSSDASPTKSTVKFPAGGENQFMSSERTQQSNPAGPAKSCHWRSAHTRVQD